jgi:hypothetical protein
LGYHHDYRTAKLPKWQKAAEAREKRATDGDDDIDMNESEDKSSDDEEDDNDNGGDGRCWPQHAHHTEDYFGHMFDAGDHSLCEI